MAFEEYRDKFFEMVGYVPTDAQWAFHKSNARIKQVAGGWRGGKSVCGEKEVLLYAPSADLIWIVSDTYETPRHQEFLWLYNDLQKIDPSFVSPKDFHLNPSGGPASMTLATGCRAVTRSAEDPERLAEVAPDVILVVEAARLTYEVWTRLLGRAAEKKAPIILTGTFETMDYSKWYEEVFTRWQGPNNLDARSFSIPSWTNKYAFEEGPYTITLADGTVVPGICEELYKIWTEIPADMFMLQYAGVPCKPAGLVLPEFSTIAHVGDYPYNPDLPVEIAVDPGAGMPGAYAVLAVQMLEGEVYLVAEKYLQGYITADVILACKQAWPWFNKIQGGAIDIYAKQKHSMPPVIEPWREAGIYLDYKYVDELAGVDTLRTFLKINPETGRPKLHVDKGCRGFISECGGGRSPVHGGGAWVRDTNTGKLKDANNHAAKALIYLLVNRFGYSAERRKSGLKVKTYW